MVGEDSVMMSMTELKRLHVIRQVMEPRIVQLNPQPVDLRNPKALYLKTDKQLARAIREGHPGTGMFPDTTLTTQELTDTSAYLAVLRQQDSRRTSKP